MRCVKVAKCAKYVANLRVSRWLSPEGGGGHGPPLPPPDPPLYILVGVWDNQYMGLRVSVITPHRLKLSCVSICLLLSGPKISNSTLPNSDLGRGKHEKILHFLQWYRNAFVTFQRFLV